MTPSLLLVEDDDDEASLAGIALQKASVRHHLLRARDGKEAFAIAGTAPAIDLVLLDLHLPRMDGTAVLEVLRRNAPTRHVPVVMYSASREPRDLAACYSRGANSYLRKSSDTRSFTDDLSLVLFYWLRLNALPGESAVHRAVRHASAGVEEEQRRSHRFSLPPVVRTEEEHAHNLAFGRRGAAVIIDAEPGLRGLVAAALRQVAGPIPVVEASSGREARETLGRVRLGHGHSPWSCARFVLIDLDADLEDGLAVIRDVRAAVDHRLPVVAFTRNDTASFVDRCYAQKVNSVVRKPEPGSVHDTVLLIGHYWLRLNQTVPAPDIMPV